LRCTISVRIAGKAPLPKFVPCLLILDNLKSATIEKDLEGFWLNQT
jgi:hypothetical protein